MREDHDSGEFLSIAYCNQQELIDLLRNDGDRVVSVNWFHDAAEAAGLDTGPDLTGYQVTRLPLRSLDFPSGPATFEVKLAPAGVMVTLTERQVPGLGEISEVCFGDQRIIRIELSEAFHASRDPYPSDSTDDMAPLRKAAFAAYCHLFSAQRENGWQALRYTNFVPGVISVDDRFANLDQHQVAKEGIVEPGYSVPPGQRYVSFNQGRFDAWMVAGPKLVEGRNGRSFDPVSAERWEPVCPAATAVGGGEGNLVVEGWYTEGSRMLVRYAQNQRQTPPVRYERRYGSRPPVFARGTHVKTEHGVGMIVSGTASLLGSEIVHNPSEDADLELANTSSEVRECLRRQIRLTVENIGFLLSPANLTDQGIAPSLELADLTGVRVYLKYADTVDVATEELNRLLPRDTSRIFLLEHICRPGWLVEIEGLAWLEGRAAHWAAS